MRSVCAVLTVVALVLAGCGGGDEGGSADTGTATEQTATQETTETTGGRGQATAAGKEVFTDNCGGCHTLADAGTNGTSAPNLDELKPDQATVERQVTNGGGQMPAFKDRLSTEQIEAVATYVSSVAGRGG